MTVYPVSGVPACLTDQAEAPPLVYPDAAGAGRCSGASGRWPGAAVAAGPAQREGEPGAGDQPGGVVRGQAGEPGGLGDRQPDRGDAGRAGLPAAGRDGRVAEGDLQVSVADVGRRLSRVVVAARLTAGRAMLPVSAPRMAAARSWARAASAVCRQIAVPGAGLGLVPAEHVLSGFERFLRRPAAPGDGDEIGHGRRPARRRPAQVEGELVRAGDQPPDQQVLARGWRWRSSPSRCSGGLWTRSRTSAARTPPP